MSCRTDDVSYELDPADCLKAPYMPFLLEKTSEEVPNPLLANIAEWKSPISGAQFTYWNIGSSSLSTNMSKT